MGTQTGTSANDTLTGGGGDDVAFGGAGNDTVYGGDGDDLSYGGTGNDALFGGNGNDANAGEKGDDAMYGGAGRDTLVGGQGHDTMYGGSDNDTMLGDGQWLNLAEYASGSGGKATNLTLTNSADGPIDLYQINGSGNSVYVATIQPGQTLVQSTTTTTNWILRDPDGYYLEPIAGASNQTVNYGPDLSDTMYGGTGDDHIRSQYGNDMVYGDDGNDAVRAGYGHDVVYGGIGNDTLYGDAGNDTIYGDAGNDTAYGGTGDDKIGSHGADSAGNDTLYGGDGNDSLIGGSENDVLYGDAGNDTLAGGVGADTLYGGADADTFAVTEDHQTDTIYGGETGNDNDAIVLTNYVTTQGVNVAFTGSEAGSYSYYGGGASGSFTGIEAIWSTAYNDTIDASASSSAQTLGAGAGDDTVTGSSGANMIYGGDGNDSLYGGAGNDTLQGDAGNDTVYAGSGDDTVYGGVGSDTLFGGTGDDSMVGGSGNDTLYGDDGNDVINGDAGNDTVYGGAGNDTVSSTVGNDLIYGGDGADNLSGGDGADTIYGGTGNDALTGGDGNDALFGGLGDDSLSGGGGADMFGVAGGEGADTISGGETGVDADTLEFTTGGVGNGVTITFTGTEAGTFSYAGGGSGTFTEVETVAGSAGGDTIDATAASGPVSIFGGDGRDTISGGTGNDHLDAGAGNDTLDGGAGNDTLTTGSGNDSIAMDRFGGADRVTDFSLTDTDHDGHYDDQIDASDLTNGQGGPVTAWDVVVTDDGFGNALLTFPEGETLILQGVPPGAMATVAQRHAAGIPCFTAGTLIATLRGEVAVETQRPGDLVTTRDQGPQPVVWTARRHLSAAGLLARPDLVPVRLTRAFTGTGRNLLVSPQHAMLIGRGRDEVLVRAIHLARLDGNQVRRAAGVREVTYVHLMFARHQIITANGTPSESFYPGPCSLAMLDAGALVSLARAFPRLGVSGAAIAYGPTARPVLRMADLPPTLNAVLAGQGLRAAQFAC